MTAAAFFDLDRTLLPSASGTIFAKHLEAEGVSSGAAKIPGANLIVALYDIFGETQLNMQATKQFVKTAKGWPVAAVERAAKAAVPDLLDAIPDYAKLLLAEHKAAGTKLVLATTTPTVLVGPLSERLGFDDVVATVWSHDDETFDGGTEGPFVWGPDKRDAIVAWAKANDVSLKESHAYSDSYYDGSMLDAVGHAVAVNPDARLAGVAALKGWTIRYLDAPPGVLKVGGFELQDLLRPFTSTKLAPAVDWSFSGLDNIPSSGPAILAFNHRSYFDTFTMQFLIAKTGRPCRFLAKRELFDNPIIGPIAKVVGGIRVDRGSGSGEPLREAITALKAGEMVAIAPQGTIPRGQAFFDPELKGRPGAAKLAIEADAPVIPVALWGTEKVWPRNQKLPSFDLTHRPQVSATVGPPVDLKKRKLETDTKRIMTAISALLPPEANEPHDPTPDELAKTYPKGHEVPS